MMEEQAKVTEEFLNFSSDSERSVIKVVSLVIDTAFIYHCGGHMSRLTLVTSRFSCATSGEI